MASEEEIREFIEDFGDNQATPQCVVDMLERLVELEEIDFRDRKPFWTATGAFLNECEED